MHGRALLEIFQSTHPLRGATLGLGGLVRHGIISIHAPLAGCDLFQFQTQTVTYHFNPRTPCGVRLISSVSMPIRRNFNPRTPCGVRLHLYFLHDAHMGFQSTHPLRGATRLDRPGVAGDRDFNPRTPCGVRLCGGRRRRADRPFQSTHPLRGATAKTYKENCTFFELADKLSARIAAKKPSAKADRCA